MSRNYYITYSGRLRRKDNTVYLEKADDARVPLPVEDIDALYLYGELDLNTRLLNFLARKHIPLHVFNYYGYYSGTYYPREYLNSGFLTVKQVQHYERNAKRLPIAREFVAGGVDNILRNLRYYANRGKDCGAQVDAIIALAKHIPTAEHPGALMGLEGNIRETYYSALNAILSLKTAYERRVRQPPDNPINAVISFGNSLIYTTYRPSSAATTNSHLIRQFPDLYGVFDRDLPHAVEPHDQLFARTGGTPIFFEPGSRGNFQTHDRGSHPVSPVQSRATQ